MILQLPILMRDGFTGEPVTVDSDDIADVFPSIFDADWCNQPVEIATVLMNDGTRHRVNRTKSKIKQMILETTNASNC